MLSIDQIRSHAEKILTAGGRYAKTAASGDGNALKAYQRTAHEASPLFESPDHPSDMQTEALRERLLGKYEAYQKLAAMYSDEGDVSGQRQERIYRIEAEIDDLESLLRRIEEED